jgi:hypothetical protein
MTVKYFFLADGWELGRVWELGGLWNESAWRRKPQLLKTSLCIVEQGQKLWLYQVEDAVLMVEVKPGKLIPEDAASQSIAQVVLKRLISAEQAITRLDSAESIYTMGSAD